MALCRAYRRREAGNGHVTRRVKVSSSSFACRRNARNSQCNRNLFEQNICAINVCARAHQLNQQAKRRRRAYR